MLIKRALSKLSGSRHVQRCLQKNVSVSQFLMGVGSGSDVSSSGEAAIFALLKGRVAPPYCVFDVGANKGQFVKVILDNLATDQLSIHCFEPGLQTFASLTSAVGLQRRSGLVKLNNFGMGREVSEAVLHFDSAGSGLASLTKRKLDHYGIDFEQSEKVRIRTVDDYCAENAIGRIDLLKIDVEGHELDALHGAAGMFAADAIGLVSFEFGGCNIDTRTYFRDFFYFFEKVAMRIFRITPSGYLSPLDTYNESLEQFSTTNFVALRKA